MITKNKNAFGFCETDIDGEIVNLTRFEYEVLKLLTKIEENTRA